MADHGGAPRGGGDEGGIRTEGRGQVLTIGIDRAAETSGFTPKIFREPAEAYSTYEAGDDWRCAALYAESDHFTAGPDPSLTDVQSRLFPDGGIDPLGPRPPFRTKPEVCAARGSCFTSGIELALASDVVVAAGDIRFARMEVKRALPAFGGAPVRMVRSAGWGNAMRWLPTGDEFDADGAPRRSAGDGGRRPGAGSPDDRERGFRRGRGLFPGAPRAGLPGAPGTAIRPEHLQNIPKLCDIPDIRIDRRNRLGPWLKRKTGRCDPRGRKRFSNFGRRRSGI